MTMSHHNFLLMESISSLSLGIILGFCILYMIRCIMFKYNHLKNQDTISEEDDDIESYHYTPLVGEELLLFPVYSIA
jgi:hypothetical protein